MGNNNKIDNSKDNKTSEKDKGGCKRLTLSLKVLILHEDYSQELPVFGVDSSSPPSSSLFCCTICVLGAVRDMTAMEECALYQACSEMQIDLVGSNLGRVAEFTSKIAITPNGHVMGKQLAKAVQQLEVLNKNCNSNINCSRNNKINKTSKRAENTSTTSYK